ncbi:phospho-N-acetylmuramoyl-pentapeptide-transferase, partial [Desulfotalea psychrophila]|nr:phospho-N-acetylmuramoyl-pentapeptide-transferase [Desulfotalea psychrophila]
MLYHFLYPLHNSFSAFNVFRYITFRSIACAVTAFLLMLLLSPWFIRKLKQYQIGQVVRDDGPETHLAKKGVPTMGGVLILSSITISTLLWAKLTNPLVWLMLFVVLFFGCIGGIDDYRKICKKS